MINRNINAAQPNAKIDSAYLLNIIHYKAIMRTAEIGSDN